MGMSVCLRCVVPKDQTDTSLFWLTREIFIVTQCRDFNSTQNGRAINQNEKLNGGINLKDKSSRWDKNKTHVCSSHFR